MAKKTGSLKRVILTLLFLALILVVFILLGGGSFLRTAGKKMEDAGKQADSMKQKVEEQAASLEKKVEQGLETIKPGEKK